MDVTLNFNGNNYTLKLHEMDIWTHSATISTNEMTTFIQEVLNNNPDIKSIIAGGASNVKK